MAWKKLKEDFQRDVLQNDPSGIDENTYRYWMLRLLFEINGNLDSLAVSHRESEKAAEARMAAAIVAFREMMPELNAIPYDIPPFPKGPTS